MTEATGKYQAALEAVESVMVEMERTYPSGAIWSKKVREAVAKELRVVGADD